MELYEERGFDQTTVAEIAARAGLTERTFFRYFTDKREVLFAGGAGLQAVMVSAVSDAPYWATPLDAVSAGLDAAAAVLQEGGDFPRRRQAIIAANAELHERELVKLAAIASALAEALRHRGVTEPAASLTAEAGIAVFRVAFERWVGEIEQREFASVISESLDELRALTAGSAPTPLG